MKHFLLIISAIALLAAGTRCFFFPDRVQEDELRSAELDWRRKVPFIMRYLRSRRYVIETKIIGAGMYLMAILFLLGLFYHGRLPVRW